MIKQLPSSAPLTASVVTSATYGHVFDWSSDYRARITAVRP
jgi:hypothetical protein